MCVCVAPGCCADSCLDVSTPVCLSASLQAWCVARGCCADRCLDVSTPVCLSASPARGCCAAGVTRLGLPPPADPGIQRATGHGTGSEHAVSRGHVVCGLITNVLGLQCSTCFTAVTSKKPSCVEWSERFSRCGARQSQRHRGLLAAGCGA